MIFLCTLYSTNLNVFADLYTFNAEWGFYSVRDAHYSMLDAHYSVRDAHYNN